MATSSYKKVITLNLDYSQFKGGISEVNSEMRVVESSFRAANAEIDENTNALNKGRKQTEKLKLEHEKLSGKIQLATRRVELNKEALEKARESGKTSQRQINSLTTAYNKSCEELSKLNKELDNNERALANTKENVTQAITVVAALSTAFVKLAVDIAHDSDELCTLSKNTGIATDTLQGWEYAASAVDISAENMTAAIRKMVNNMDSAATGSGNAYTAFRRLGISVNDVNGNLKDAESMFYDTIDALGKVENKTERDAIAMDIFGKSAQDLSGVIDAGSSGMRDFVKQADDLGHILSTKDLEAAAACNDQLELMEKALNSAGAQIGLALIPIITDLANAIASIPAPVLKTIAVIASIIVSIVLVVRAIKSVSGVGEAVGKLLSTFNKVSGKQTMMTILAIVAALTALAAAIAVIMNRSREFQSTMKSISASKSTVPSAGGNTGHNASGTPNWRGGRTWVGENGPEIVELPAGTTIYNNSQSSEMTGDTNIFNVSVDASSIRDFEAMISVFNGIKRSRGRGGKVNG